MPNLLPRTGAEGRAPRSYQVQLVMSVQVPGFRLEFEGR